MTPFYDPLLTYEENYASGPFGAFVDPVKVESAAQPAERFLGHLVHRPFGIPAGPLLNARFCAAAFTMGFDINVYKTVRTRFMRSPIPWRYTSLAPSRPSAPHFRCWPTATSRT